MPLYSVAPLVLHWNAPAGIYGGRVFKFSQHRPALCNRCGNVILAPFYGKSSNICQDRLGTNMLKVETKTRVSAGFPAVGSDYWNEQTIRGVQERYPSMDMRPYVEGATMSKKAAAATAAATARL
jgi:hypothetical protein